MDTGLISFKVTQMYTKPTINRKALETDLNLRQWLEKKNPPMTQYYLKRYIT